MNNLDGNDSSSKQELDARSLRQHVPLLNIDILCSGDVLLTSGRGVTSRVVSSLTRGPFSHAALWIAARQGDSPLLIEADRFGVGITILPTVSLSFHDAAHIATTHSVPDRPRDWMLLRHPEIQALDPTLVAAAADRFLIKVLHEPYSELSRLVNATTLHLDATLRQVLAFAESFRSPSPTDGVFCSELVAMFFADMGVRLFQDDRAATTVNPNDLASSQCLLRPVREAFLDVDSKTVTKATVVRGHRRRDELPALVSSRKQHIFLLHSIEETTKETVQLADTAADTGQTLANDLYEQMVLAAERSERNGAKTLADRFRVLSTKMFMANQWNAVNDSLYRQSRDSPGTMESKAAWVQAHSCVARAVEWISDEAERDFTLLNALEALRLIRSLKGANLPDQIQESLSIRRRLIIDKVLTVRAIARMRQLQRSFEESVSLSSEARVLVAQVIQRAKETTAEGAKKHFGKFENGSGPQGLNPDELKIA